MLRTPSEGESRKPQESRLNGEVQAAVRVELNRMLEAQVFAQSSRCKRFLHYIVEETLAGNAGQLKERTIGIGVFDRPADYDTGDDSIVRVTANEVRKRLGQFYRESKSPHSIQFELPRGSYVPEFRVQATRRIDEVSEGPRFLSRSVEVVNPQSPASDRVRDPGCVPRCTGTGDRHN